VGQQNQEIEELRQGSATLKETEEKLKVLNSMIQ
jgi:hypothetical protein